MSGYAAITLLSTAATIDAAKSAKHQGRLQMEEQKRQMDAATQMQQQELQQTERLQTEQLNAQRAAQSANLAQANRAAAESKSMMDRQMKSADEAMNRANQKRPNTRALMDDAAQQGKTGASGTMLTGAQGVDPSSLTLGRSTLLGQ
jgi:hypothetical protein